MHVFYNVLGAVNFKTMEEKRWFMNDKNEVRWVHTFIRKNIEYDNGMTHLVVSMPNNLNKAWINNKGGGCILEEISIKNFFPTKEACQIEIIRRERFGV